MAGPEMSISVQAAPHSLTEHQGLGKRDGRVAAHRAFLYPVAVQHGTMDLLNRGGI
jgi:hypothetical protein